MILFSLIFVILTTWLIVLFNQESVNTKNEEKYRGIYSNKDWYD